MDHLLNFVGFQVGWFACVLGAGRGRPWAGPLLALPILGWHLWSVEDRPGELAFLVSVLALGIAADSLQERAGLLSYGRAGRPVKGLCPLWIATLWLLFASTFHGSLGWLVGKPWLAALLGGVGGALSYRGGQALGALRLGAPPMRSLWLLALIWAGLVPLVTWLAGLPALGAVD